MVDVFEIMGDKPLTTVIADAMIITRAKIDRYDKILVSISGGYDSDIMLDMCWRLDSEKKCEYVFFDTGIEYEATKRHLDFLEKKYGIQIRREKAPVPVPLGCKRYGQPFLTKHVSEMMSRLQKHNFQWEDEPFEVLIKKYPNCKSALNWWCNQHKLPNGKQSQMNISKHKLLKEFIIANPPKFKISQKCCNGAKKQPARQIEKQGNYELGCTGIRKLENGIRSQQYKSCFTPSKNSETDYFRPIFWFSDEDKKIYSECFGVENSDCYKVWGMTRTGCAACPFGSGFEDELDIIEKYQPKLYIAVNNIFKDSYEYTRAYRIFKINSKNFKQKV